MVQTTGGARCGWMVLCGSTGQRPSRGFLWYHKWVSETSLSLQTLQQSNGSTVGVPTGEGLYLPLPPHTQTNFVFLVSPVCLLQTNNVFGQNMM